MFVSLTMPHMRQYLELAGLLGAIYILQTFDVVFVLTPLNPQTENLPNLIYQTVFSKNDYGLAAAQGVDHRDRHHHHLHLRAAHRVQPVPGGERAMTATTTTPTTPGRTSVPVSPKKRMSAGGIIAGIAAWIIGLIFITPVLMMVLTSFHPESQASLNAPSLFAPLTLEGYREFFGSTTGQSPWPYLRNSFVASIVSTLLVLIVAIRRPMRCRSNRSANGPT